MSSAKSHPPPLSIPASFRPIVAAFRPYPGFVVAPYRPIMAAPWPEPRSVTTTAPATLLRQPELPSRTRESGPLHTWYDIIPLPV